MRKDNPIVAALRIVVFAVAVLVLNFPVIATIVTSLKSEAEITSNPSFTIDAPTFDNYRRIFAMADRFDVVHFLTNSLIEAAVGSAMAIVLAVPAAFALARFHAGEKWLLPVVANLRAIPLIIFSIPIYLMYQQTGLLDTRFGLALVMCVINLPLVLVLLTNSIRELPDQLDEAARVDGASVMQLLIHIVLPLAKPAIASSAILAFIYSWNEFLFGLMLTTRSAVPVTVGASFFFAASGGGVRWGTAAAVMILSVLPPLILGLIAYKHIGDSLTEGAVKG